MHGSHIHYTIALEYARGTHLLASSISLSRRNSSLDAPDLDTESLLLLLDAVELLVRSEVAEAALADAAALAVTAAVLIAAANSLGDGAPKERKPPASELFREQNPMLEAEVFLELDPPPM